MANDETPGFDWAGYYRWIEGRAVRPLLQRALTEYGEVSPGATAVDIGCGDGTETRALLEAGFSVTAMDSAEASLDLLARLPETGSTLTLVHAPMQDAELPAADLVFAALSLPFCPRPAFDALWSRVRGALRPGGLLACDLFGDRHDWASEGQGTFMTRAEVLDRVAGLDLRSLHEIEEEARTYRGPTHWHDFQVVARNAG
jgi:trans-aconitate methyltransferase